MLVLNTFQYIRFCIMPLPKCKDLHNALTRSKKLRVAIGCYSISFCQKKKQKYLLILLPPRIHIS